jgi:hypothetical protein
MATKDNLSASAGDPGDAFDLDAADENLWDRSEKETSDPARWAEAHSQTHRLESRAYSKEQREMSGELGVPGG